LRKNELVRRKLSFPREKYISNFVAITTIACSFLYWLVIYHWKSFKKSYNFIIESTSIKIDTNSLEQLKLLFLEHMVGLKKQMCLKLCAIILFHMNFN
jgi:hypothetical protein